MARWAGNRRFDNEWSVDNAPGWELRGRRGETGAVEGGLRRRGSLLHQRISVCATEGPAGTSHVYSLDVLRTTVWKYLVSISNFEII